MRYSPLAERWCKLVSKMPCGRIYNIPFYGTLRAYRDKSNKRKFALYKSHWFIAGGNLPLEVVLVDIRQALE